MPGTGPLEVTVNPEELYLTCGRGESRHRPIFTADVYELTDSSRVMVAEHPCSMRRGVAVADTLMVAPVEEHDPVPRERLESGYYDRFPLPALDGEGSFAVGQLGQLQRCRSDLLVPDRRVACMLPLGINQFQQRLVWYLTRFVVSTTLLEEAFGRYYHEADIIEECLEAAVAAGMDLATATADVDAALGRPGGSGDDPPSLRDLLGEPQQRTYVRREMRQWVARQFGDPDRR